MTFTSCLFIIGFFPLFAFLYSLTKSSGQRKLLILIANILFYVGAGIGSFMFLVMFSFCIYFLVLWISRHKSKIVITVSLIISLMPLLFFKYSLLITNTVNKVLGGRSENFSFIVPLGISFFTFEAVSLLVDTYRNESENAPRLSEVFLYLTFFTTITAGPIVRYNEFYKGVTEGYCVRDYAHSIEKIVIGLSKKVLIADKLATLTNYYFDGVALGKNFSTIGLWVGSISFSLQLYFDFSGYSDMAIGMSQLVGFDFAENFNYPYQAESISDFWKRWHISLTGWFKDYVYIPLGGNRCGKYRQILNMLVVWMITGIWHGTDLKFLLWAGGYFILLVFEKYCHKGKRKIPVVRQDKGTYPNGCEARLYKV